MHKRRFKALTSTINPGLKDVITVSQPNAFALN